MSNYEEEELCCLWLLLEEEQRLKKRRRWDVRRLNEGRAREGAFHNYVNDTTLDTTLDPDPSAASSLLATDVEPLSTDTDSPAPASSSIFQLAATTIHRKKRKREPPMSAVQAALTKHLEKIDANLNEEKSFTDDIGMTLTRMPLVKRGQCKVAVMLLVQKWFEECQEPEEQ
ncbi:hypothetical protein AALO_G00154800 [Alosa alosa]|uniref:Uncharacterized protein n=1 Tax=Alosa alosa TaxID=278164 RepID=A0AAV6GK49_9TELE|nr:hypothetical protein AALO_G00154800 [Alosa alosa]